MKAELSEERISMCTMSLIPDCLCSPAGEQSRC